MLARKKKISKQLADLGKVMMAQVTLSSPTSGSDYAGYGGMDQGLSSDRSGRTADSDTAPSASISPGGCKMHRGHGRDRVMYLPVSLAAKCTLGGNVNLTK